MINTYAHRIDRVKSIIGGVEAHADKLAKWGVTPEFIAKMNQLYQQAGEVEQQRNAIKASAQQTTTLQEQIMTELESNCNMWPESSKDFESRVLGKGLCHFYRSIWET